MPSSESRKPGAAFLLAQLGAHAAARFAERLQPLKLTPAQAGILRAINTERGMSQQRLADLLGMFPSRLVLVLDELQRAGLLERRPDETDRRMYALYLTAKGEETLRAIGRIAREHQDALCAALSSAERETLAGLLSRIAEEQQMRPGIHPGYQQRGGRDGKDPE